MSTVETTAQVAERLGRDPRYVLRLVERGQLVPVAKLPGRTGAYLFSPESVQVLIDHGPTHDTADHRPILRRESA